MTISKLIPTLRTWDLSGSIAFYCQVLGFSCNKYTEEDGWASLSYHGIELNLTSPNDHEGDVQPAFTGSLYFHVKEVEKLWVRLQQQARVCYPLESFPYGMHEFAIYDNNGYLLQFGEPIEFLDQLQ